MTNIGLNEWSGGWDLEDDGWEKLRLVDKWMRELERSSLVHTMKGDEVVEKMILNETKEEME